MALSGPAKTVAQTVSLVIVMGALAWASVPFYDWFCRVTGFGGVTGVSDVAPDNVLDQTITVRFDGSLHSQMPWSFKPVVREMDVRIGETGLAFYEAYNPTNRPIAGSASYNVTPYQAGGFFNKIQCFCFEEQVLQPGERVQMPVTFYVDPEIVEDRDGKYVHTITLSYTFYEIDLPEGYAAAQDMEPTSDTSLN
ncbi:cytochrome c oxidase assembly protein [Roseobacter sp. YSTF-M11]|uniref:Cytochrome c oxidase assembly protein CtaG n=1 Tax=Roseobacter insulae TaxID=2859783 RepID=A0A9X1K2K2_9RHOB|nr:cytochrome c oxidase assembly protein [Roseobacter insulae]MBW4707667.1 cytochrome c oxidase assembly protein [Roseobacter insulae]